MIARPLDEKESGCSVHEEPCRAICWDPLRRRADSPGKPLRSRIRLTRRGSRSGRPCFCRLKRRVRQRNDFVTALRDAPQPIAVMDLAVSALRACNHNRTGSPGLTFPAIVSIFASTDATMARPLRGRRQRGVDQPQINRDEHRSGSCAICANRCSSVAQDLFADCIRRHVIATTDQVDPGIPSAPG